MCVKKKAGEEEEREATQYYYSAEAGTQAAKEHIGRGD